MGVCVCVCMPIPCESSSYIRVCLCKIVECAPVCLQGDLCDSVCVGGNFTPYSTDVGIYIPVWCDYM